MHLSEETFKKMKDDMEELKKKKHVEKMISLFQLSSEETSSLKDSILARIERLEQIAQHASIK